MDQFVARHALTFFALLFGQVSHAEEIPFWGPVNGCSFYKEFGSKFWGCAEPRIHPNTCTIKRCVGPACVTYRGERGSMYRPVFLIEVTSRFGKSLFAEAFPTILGKHLEAGKAWYEKKNPLPATPISDSSSVDQTSSKELFWHARVLAVPFATAAFGYYDLPALAKMSAAIPTCFYGASEFVPDQWNLGLADLPFATAWASIGVRQCNLPGASIPAQSISIALANGRAGGASALASNVDLDFGESFGLGCAYGVPGSWLLAQNLRPSSDALSYTKLCMGELGPLLPRQGLINNDDPFRSAVSAAWKFASLTKDAFFDSIGGIEPSDKWQLVYPISEMSGCYRPQVIHEDWPLGGPSELKRKPVEEGTTYIFAIWRKNTTSTCYESGTADWRWKTIVKEVNYQAIRGFCKL